MKPRGRPKKERVVQKTPPINKFSPRGKPGRPDETTLSLDEFEAIRLVDLLNSRQKEAAKSMQISQQTLSRIIKRGRKILADSIVNGKRITIQNQTSKA